MATNPELGSWLHFPTVSGSAVGLPPHTIYVDPVDGMPYRTV